MMNKNELEKRTKQFALDSLQWVSSIRTDRSSDMLCRQFLRSSTSIGANYREANRAESKDDFIHKIALVEKEASETAYWLELMEEIALGEPQKRSALRKESGELLSIFCAIGKTSKRNRTLTPDKIAQRKSK
jgi:four helix bundle protein